MHTSRLVLVSAVCGGILAVSAAPDAGKLRQAAAAGDTAAQVTLAHHYRCGGIVPREPRAAYNWASEAAKAGNPVGAMMKGLALRDGDGPIADAAAAAAAFEAAWSGGLERLAGGDDPLAKAYCGLGYLQGAGVAASATKAIPFLEAAAEVGMAQRELAFALLSDRARRISLDKAVAMIEEAAETGDAQAIFLLSGFYRKGNGVRQDEKRADRLLREAARQGSRSAQVAMARQILEGEPGMLEYRQAATWYRQAAEQGDPESQEALAWMLFNGSAGERNLAEAASWFGAAARNNRLSAQVQYARILFEGLGRERDAVEAARWYRRAADAGNPEAQFMMAWMHFNGRGLTANETLARQWLARAAENGHLLACFSYGTMLESGRGGNRDAAAAREFYERAARGGLPQAQFNLGMMLAEGATDDKLLGAAWLKLAAESGLGAAGSRLEELKVKEAALAEAVTGLREGLERQPTVQSLLPAEAQTFAGYGRAATGWVTDRGLVATSAKLVAGARTVRVHLSATDVRVATIEQLDVVNDVAILRLAGPRPKAWLSMRRRAITDEKGEEVVIAGFGSPNRIGLGAELAVGRGVGSDADVRLLRLTVGYAATLVGGPVLDRRGEVVGMMLETPGADSEGVAVRGAYVGALLGLSDDEEARRPGHEMKVSALADWIADAVVLVTVD